MRQFAHIFGGLIFLIIVLAIREHVTQMQDVWPSACVEEMVKAGNLERWSRELCSQFHDRQSLYKYLSTKAAQEGRPDEYYLSKQGEQP